MIDPVRKRTNEVDNLAFPTRTRANIANVDILLRNRADELREKMPAIYRNLTEDDTGD